MISFHHLWKTLPPDMATLCMLFLHLLDWIDFLSSWMSACSCLAQAGATFCWFGLAVLTVFGFGWVGGASITVTAWVDSLESEVSAVAMFPVMKELRVLRACFWRSLWTTGSSCGGPSQRGGAVPSTLLCGGVPKVQINLFNVFNNKIILCYLHSTNYILRTCSTSSVFGWINLPIYYIWAHG